MEAKDFEALDQKIAEAKAEAENKVTGQDIANAVMDVAKQPKNMVRVAVSNNVAQKMKDPNVVERLDKTSDKILDSELNTIENEADASENRSQADKLQTYFDAHKEELATAGIESPTYQEDMERAVKCHKFWCNVHWYLFGWWMTGIRTMILKAKPFKIILNVLAILLGLLAGTGIVFLLIKLFSLF